ncbi:MAG: hypothetical protein PHP28_05590 [Actinomycetota bacterium]|nr:hypothetical protein [Actinomycetota bacterium]MDD5667234.1 hypothetical protein [Actinomycetota bacterium]
MKASRFICLAVILLLVAGGLSLSSCGGEAQGGNTSVGDIDAFREALASDEFTVQEGKLEVFNILDMYNAGLIPSCWGNNAQAPYMVYKLPESPGQTAPNTITDAPLRPENEGLWGDYRLRRDEAIVYIGPTPPECSYFSYRSYLAGRYFPAVGRSQRVFASLGDTINNMTINSTGTPGGKAGDAFEGTTVIITAADSSIEQRVRAALQEAGYSMDVVNTDIIPQSLVRMGLEAEADSFVFIHRVAFFEDEQAGEDYMASAQGTVLRLTPQTVDDPDPFAVPELRVRGTGDASELDLTADVEMLRQAILEKHAGLLATELKTSIWLLEGYDAIQRGIDVLGENRDTGYLWTDQFTLGDDPEEFVIVYGVNHAAFGKATYSNVSIYGFDIKNGVAGVENTSLAGTADEYLPGNPNAKYLYVWKIARDAGGDPDCLAVPTWPGAYGIPLDANCYIAFRAYLEQETRVGPYWFELFYDRAIKFDPR